MDHMPLRKSADMRSMHCAYEYTEIDYKYSNDFDDNVCLRFLSGYNNNINIWGL